MSWTSRADETLRMLLENMVAEGVLAKSIGLDATPAQIVGASREMLLDVIRSSLPLAHIMDESDLVLHAEGPAVRDDSPRLAAVNWLTSTAEATIRKLSSSLFDLADRDAKRLSGALDLRLTGFARGSLYTGLALAAPSPGLFSQEDEPVVTTVRKAIRNLPVVSRYIRDEDIDPEIAEIVPDPAQRDTSLSALLMLSPTGRRGIHSVDITSPGEHSSNLSQRERVVLREIIKNPLLQQRKEGSFVGEIREIDLDSHRFHLRNVTGVGNIRCVLATLDPTQAKIFLGESVRVNGEYECNHGGRPRLMLVRRIEVVPHPTQTEFPE